MQFCMCLTKIAVQNRKIIQKPPTPQKTLSVNARNCIFDTPEYLYVISILAKTLRYRDRSLSTRHSEPRFGVDCMKLRHTPLYRRNVFIDFYFGQLLSPNGCVPALGKFGNGEKSCKNDEKTFGGDKKLPRPLGTSWKSVFQLIWASRIRSAPPLSSTRQSEYRR